MSATVSPVCIKYQNDRRQQKVWSKLSLIDSAPDVEGLPGSGRPLGVQPGHVEAGVPVQEEPRAVTFERH
jgi:hypothetical protein